MSFNGDSLPTSKPKVLPSHKLGVPRESASKVGSKSDAKQSSVP